MIVNSILFLNSSPQPLSPEKTAPGFSNNLTDAERMRQARNQEARELIGSRVGAAKAMFTKHTSEGQLQSKWVFTPSSNLHPFLATSFNQ